MIPNDTPTHKSTLAQIREKIFLYHARWIWVPMRCGNCHKNINGEKCARHQIPFTVGLHARIFLFDCSGYSPWWHHTHTDPYGVEH